MGQDSLIFIGKTFKSTPSRTPPRQFLVLLVLGIVVQLLWGSTRPPLTAKAEDLPRPPAQQWLQLGAFGDQVALARILMLWLQNFDNQPGLAIPFRNLNYANLEKWLELIQTLDPRSEYPLFAALYLYAGTSDLSRTRIMLDFIYRQFHFNPEQRWRWLAFAAVRARHRLNDPQLALLYLNALLPEIKRGRLPQWVLGVRLSLLQSTGQLESARQLVGGLLAHGEIHSPTEITFLSEWLKKIEEVVANDR